MKLYLLRNREDLQDLNPWKPWYDKVFGFVVRAENASQARSLAAEHCGDEASYAWLDAAMSTCIELTADGDSEVIIQDYHAS